MMAQGFNYDVVNGDADGLCALHQWRLAFPLKAHLITGVKRDIALLQQVPLCARNVTVMDISLDENCAPAKALLEAGAHIFYVDHHSAEQNFQHPELEFHWDDSPQQCSSLLVDQLLQGRFRAWAITAAFGDNLAQVAQTLAQQAGMDSGQSAALQALGRLLNYNAYGESIADLHVAPAALYADLHQYQDPAGFIASSSYFRLLQAAYQEDTAHLAALHACCESASAAIFLLPNQAWARRISGELANQLKLQRPQHSFAVLSERSDGDYLVSVRSAHPEAKAASQFCAQFSSGGGRRAAGGINHLPVSQLAHFQTQFFAYF